MEIKTVVILKGKHITCKVDTDGKKLTGYSFSVQGKDTAPCDLHLKEKDMVKLLSHIYAYVGNDYVLSLLKQLSYLNFCNKNLRHHNENELRKFKNRLKLALDERETLNYKGCTAFYNEMNELFLITNDYKTIKCNSELSFKQTVTRLTK